MGRAPPRRPRRRRDCPSLRHFQGEGAPRIHAFNQQADAPYYKLSLNQFGDMTEDEVDMSYGDCAMEYEGGSAYEYEFF
jgi:hypothetical protein